MAITWEPVWELVTVEHEGMRIRVLRDKETGLLACPICLTETVKKKGRKAADEGSFFFDVQSLIAHLTTHAS
ncbi:hypothetical protein [Ignicoccus hospitalis]|uniref:Uncharacterized protein n=1 Tax=Ignicoccus hospitalis (strain KIN4/I / DSM 18386 / JCM 14125) TaxID=453591 RepID=A8AB13_IGNH4|nr:hypothetical protein [Ignicoccus hospitalis]ABU82115.1 hypothetical protein Igni_0935 [Ignicoccus hospitalis KIN4/I]HIH91073.1 hypothetical protein [Desulfurococcaceae archaeon]